MARWTAEEIDTLRVLHALDTPVARMARQLNRSRHAIYRMLTRLDLPTKSGAGTASFDPADMKRFGVRMGYINREVPAKLQDDLVRAAATRGTTVAAEIVRRLGE
jgi:hypothetical protein